MIQGSLLFAFNAIRKVRIAAIAKAIQEIRIIGFPDINPACFPFLQDLNGSR